MTLSQLIAETYIADEAKFFVFCDAGNGCGFGAAGQAVRYEEDQARAYGHIDMRQTEPHMSDDRVETVYASDWIEGDNGYRFQVRF